MKHIIPTVGLRFEYPNERGDVVYSSDTEPCDSMLRLAQRARILIHESTGALVGHTSARQAGEIASKAQVSELVLIHYPGRDGNEGELVKSARETFDGAIRLAEDFMEIEL